MPRRDVREEQRPLRVGDALPLAAPAPLQDPPEEVVECADGAAEQALSERKQLALDALDVGSIRNDEDGLPVERSEVALQEARDLASVRRARQESQRHSAHSSFRPGGQNGAKPLGARFFYAALGRRPRRAVARPGIWPAHVSQRSPAFDPRRASAYVTRRDAPLPSSTSFPQLSQTSTVLRAKVPPRSRFGGRRTLLAENAASQRGGDAARA